MAGIFQSGVWSMGFDMYPPTSIFTINPSGNAVSGETYYGYGYSWGITAQGTSAPGFAFNTNLTTVITGFRYYFLDLLQSTPNMVALWWDTTASTYQVYLTLDSTGTLAVWNSSGLLGSASGVISTVPTWAYLEAKVVINSSSGSFQLKLNGNTIINLSGINTQSTANTWVSGFLLANSSGFTTSGFATYVDDIYILDTTGASPLNTFLAPTNSAAGVFVRGDLPNNNSAVGGRNAWTATNPTGTNWENVAAVDFPTEYNFSSTVGQYDMFRFPALPSTTSSVLFINEWLIPQLDSSGARTVAFNCYSNTTDQLGSAFTPTTFGNTYSNMVISLDPHTNASWSVTNAGSAELGIKVIS